MHRILPCALLLALAGCAVFTPAELTPEQRAQAAIVAACREQADRLIERQDRGQLLREDERNARLGIEAGPNGVRTQIDLLGRQFRRDQLVQECLRQHPAMR